MCYDDDRTPPYILLFEFSPQQPETSPFIEQEVKAQAPKAKIDE